METILVFAAIKSENCKVNSAYCFQNRRNNLLKGLITEYAVRIFLGYYSNNTYKVLRVFIKKNGKNSYGIKKKMKGESRRERNRDGPKPGFFPAHETLRCKCLCTKTCAWNY